MLGEETKNDDLKLKPDFTNVCMVIDRSLDRKEKEEKAEAEAAKLKEELERAAQIFLITLHDKDSKTDFKVDNFTKNTSVKELRDFAKEKCATG
jgi:hypothetical protein